MLLLIASLFLNLSAESAPIVDRIICYERFADELYEMTGDRQVDDATCRAMLISGAVGLCFEGRPQVIVDQMNTGLFAYSDYQKVIPGQAEVLTQNIIRYASYEGDFVGWTRDDNEIFRCPEFSQIKKGLTSLAEALETSVDTGVSRRYREEFGLPSWLQEKD